MGFLDVMANHSLHLIQDKNKFSQLRAEFSPYAQAFKEGSSIPDRFAPGLSYMLGSSVKKKAANLAKTTKRSRSKDAFAKADLGTSVLYPPEPSSQD